MNYNEADKRLHFLSQLVAKANRTYVPKRDDDSHTNLYLDMVGRRIVGRWIQNNNKSWLPSINIDTLDFEWINSSLKTVGKIKTTGRSVHDVEEEISKSIEKLGMNPAGYSADLHFEIPAYEFQHEDFIDISDRDIAEWCAVRELANEVCFLVAGYWQKDVETRIWPHHFDTGIYAPLNDSIGIGVGFAMQDKLVGAPYLYISGYGLNGKSLSFKELPKQEIGEWKITENWKGYTIALDEMYDDVGFPDHDLLESMVKIAIDFYLDM